MLLVHAGLGAIIGSFLNVLVIRGRTGASLLGRSGCMSCSATLRPLELVPVLSWLFLRGRCSTCGSHISAQYPLVELLTAVGFVLVWGARLPLVPHALMLALVALWIAIAVYDMRHTIIPDPWAYLAAGTALVLVLFLEVPEMFSYLVYGALVCAGPLAALWHFSGGTAMGLGDAKLALSIGFLLGPTYGLSAVLAGFVLGALYALAVLLPLPYYRMLYTAVRYARLSAPMPHFTMKSEVPFGPFLILGALLIWTMLAYHIPLPL